MSESGQSRRLVAYRRFPFYPDKQKSLPRVGMSQERQNANDTNGLPVRLGEAHDNRLAGKLLPR
jgi:hypothetical protein